MNRSSTRRELGAVTVGVAVGGAPDRVRQVRLPGLRRIPDPDRSRIKHRPGIRPVNDDSFSPIVRDVLEIYPGHDDPVLLLTWLRDPAVS